MKCLVTGGCGFIGSHVVDALIEAGHDVVVVDNLSTGSEDNLNDKARLYYCDIRDFDYKESFDYIFHLASLARIQPSIDNPTESHDVNVNGTLNLLQFARRTGAKFIFSSTSCNYQMGMRPTKEKEKQYPKNPYGLQKIAAELYIELYNHLYGLQYTILRYFNVFGERQILEGAYAAVVGVYLKQHAEDKALTITGSGEQRRDFTYVKDVARANLMAMDWQNEVVNIGTGTNYSMNELADRIGGEKQYLPKRQGEVFETKADISKATSYGWKPTVDIMDWIDEELGGSGI